MLSERHCIQNDLADSAELLSAEALISCDSLDYGCDGGHLERTMEFLEDESIPAVACSESLLSYIGETLSECPMDSDEAIEQLS